MLNSMFMFYITLQSELWVLANGKVFGITLYYKSMAMCYIRMVSHKFIWFGEIEKAIVPFEIQTWRIPNEAETGYQMKPNWRFRRRRRRSHIQRKEFEKDMWKRNKTEFLPFQPQIFSLFMDIWAMLHVKTISQHI